MFPNVPSPAKKYEFIIPLFLFLAFLALTLPGISWGAPDGWHPDEIVQRSIKALHGEWIFDSTNFDYPSLPSYVMFGLGKLMLGFGKTDRDIMIACRILSAILAGASIILTYVITRRVGGSISIAGLSGLLLLSVSEMQHNGHFAHNDTYITLFSLLTVLFLINYQKTEGKVWLYVSFLSVGMAASSKYNGVSLVAVPVFLYLFSQRYSLRRNLLAILETLFIGGALTFLGFAIGTPTALFRMSFYFRQMIPALLHTGNFGRQADSVRGIIGQYQILAVGLGLPLFLLFSIALIWAFYKIYQAYRSKADAQDFQAGSISTLLLCALALDLPILISYNYQLRFFLPMMPILAVIGAFFVGDLYGLIKQKEKTQYQYLTTALLAFVILFSLARNISVMLLFLNDSRIPASEYLTSLPNGSSIEYTYYPPSIPQDHFKHAINYPIYFIKAPGDKVPNDAYYKYSPGEAGLDERGGVDYLVLDSFTWNKFNNQYTCDAMQVECEFFKQLISGQSDRYQPVKEFSYSLPSFLPQIEIAFVNPEIRIFERIK